MIWVLALLLFVVWVALYLDGFRSHDIDNRKLIQVLKTGPKKVESEEVLAERAACARIAEMLERDEKVPRLMRQYAARIRVLIQARSEQ